ncbi:Hypp6432 [Branchiostoma lanceolatum]|uniref:Hypp6432 protein n=1 Tax=Branchiostoma lanceolatum TaxID=7740 RepID=A0A8J9YUB4_BRALA|nr:Hypp6432 [Branchiostoma lanceolatum]
MSVKFVYIRLAVNGMLLTVADKGDPINSQLVLKPNIGGDDSQIFRYSDSVLCTNLTSGDSELACQFVPNDCCAMGPCNKGFNQKWFHGDDDKTLMSGQDSKLCFTADGDSGEAVRVLPKAYPITAKQQWDVIEM